MPGGFWGSGSTTGGASSSGGFWKGASVSAPSSGGGGGGPLNFVKNLGSDAVGAIEGLPAGVESFGKAIGHDSNALMGHVWGPLGLATAQEKKAAAQPSQLAALGGAIGKQYATEYGPLVHGNLGGFAHEIEQHPLGPILDALTVASLGAGGAAKVGSALSKAGAISDTSRLATLGKAADLTVPDFGGGEPILIKQTATNPLAKARQIGMNAALNSLPSETPLIGSTARGVRALSRLSAKEGARIDVQAGDFAKAFANLSKDEKAAWHLQARGLTPQSYSDLLTSSGENVSPAMLQTLANPKLSELVANPTPKLQAALDTGRALSDRLTALRVEAGHIDEQTALEAPYRHLRLASGATVQEVPAPSVALKAATAERDRIAGLHANALAKEADWQQLNRGLFTPGGTPVLGTPLASNPFRNDVVRLGNALEVAQERVDRLANSTTKTNTVKLVGGPSVESLIRKIDEQGGVQPFHVKDVATVKNGPRPRWMQRASGYAAPAQGVKQSRLVLASQGRINLGENALLRDYHAFRNQAQAQLLHDELVKHAAIVGKGEQIPAGWEELKLNRGQPSASYVQRIAAPLEHELQPPSLLERLREAGHPGALPETSSEDPFRLVVPAQVRRLVEDESKSYASRLSALRGVPLSAWKMLVLGLRPAFFANITIGNSILGMLQMAPGRWGFVGWLNQVAPGFEKVAGPRLSIDTMKEVFPEQATTFAGSVSHRMYHGSNRVLRGIETAAQGVTPATIGYENVLRRSLAEGWARATPEVQQVMERNGGDVNAALRQVAQTSPQTTDAISRRIDNALGNYRTYNKFERAIKSVVPFYGWNRHITSSLFRLASERPQLLDALMNTGEQGKAQADRILGALPPYLEGSLPVHLPSWLGGQQGATTILDPSSWNPFSTIVDEGRLAANLAGGKAGAASDAYPLAPDVTALIEQMTGRSLLTGAPIKGNAFADEAKNLSPQVSLFTRGTPKPTATNQNGQYAQLMRLLGLPVENLNLAAAHKASGATTKGSSFWTK